jgi:hypothetical protein
MKNMTVLFVGLIAMAAWVLSRSSVDASVSDASTQLYADARLSAVEIKREVESRIVALHSQLTHSDTLPKQQELRRLRDAIVTLRVYGQDISSTAKKELRALVRYLRAKGFKDMQTIKELERVVNESAEMMG